jgi:hypothetical protein
MREKDLLFVAPSEESGHYWHGKAPAWSTTKDRLQAKGEETMKPAESNSCKNRRSRPERPLSERLNTRLASYAAAASAAGVGMLATATAANARIVYTPAYIVIDVDSPLPLDLNHDGINDFSLRYSVFAVGSVKNVRPAQAGNAILGMSLFYLGYRSGTLCKIAVARQAGDRIGAGSRFGPYNTLFFSSTHGACGEFEKGNARYLGLEFTVNGQKHFGWARVNLQPFALTGYAYETVPGRSIRAGQTGPAASANLPELHRAPASNGRLQSATLGLLALGRLGLDVWRREKETAVGT